MKKSTTGFTIVELLIVIVVIAILAAISIAAYSGVQNRSRTSAAQSLANQIQKKAEAWRAVEGIYPTYGQLRSNNSNAAGNGTIASPSTDANWAGSTAGPEEAKLDNPTKLWSGTTPADETTILYRRCSTSSAQIQYYDALVSAAKIIALGGASVSTLCTSG